MEQQPIEVDIDEANELLFKVQIEGTEVPAKTRLVCEGKDVGYMFSGGFTNEPGVIQFVIPNMKGKIAEGVYNAKLEVLIENRCFSPIEFKLQFKKQMTVVAESLSSAVTKKLVPEVKVTTASLIEVRKQPTLRDKFSQKKR
jgi:hypothetical protein